VLLHGSYEVAKIKNGVLRWQHQYTDAEDQERVISGPSAVDFLTEV
jgi:hypothetical protein